MGLSLVDAFVRGHRGAWIGLFAVVLIIAAVALSQRGPRYSPRRVLLLSGLVSALAASSTLLAMAVAIPRIVWRPVALPPYAVASGDTWRSMRAPSTVLFAAGKPEIGVVGVDGAGKVRLFGLFSGAPVEGLPDAPSEPPAAGGARICAPAGDPCRAWPRAWPSPAAATGTGELLWTRELLPGVLAYDPENSRFLQHIEGLRSGGAEVAMTGDAAPAPAAGVEPATERWALEQIGKITSDPPRDGASALFVARRVVGSRLDAVRVVSVPAGDSFVFSVERATVSLSAPRAAYRWFGRPLLLGLLLWFPAVSLLLQAAPAWWASRRRKRVERGEPVSEMPGDAAHFVVQAREAMAVRVYPFAMLAVGLALLAPAVVAVVALVAGR